jgi:serralysin
MMPATTTVSPTGDPYVDGVIYGTKWAVDSFTYSFPTSPSYYGVIYGYGEPLNNFEAFNATQQDAARSALDMFASVANVTFTEVTETQSQHGDLRYAMSDTPSTAWAYFPTTASEGGDAWFNNSSTWYDNPVMGNYAWASIIHETGHAMGLKHPHEVSGDFGAMPADRDSLEYSIMSYHSYVGQPISAYSNAPDSFPQTLMMYDIAGLQALYGANYNTNAGDTVYTWDPATGQESIDGVAQTMPVGDKIFMTLWDGGGNDTYDFSNYTTNLDVNLQPGEWTTVAANQLANLGDGHTAVGNIANALLYQDNPASLIENAIGGSGNDIIVGNAADNHLTGGGGNDTIDGGAGVNTAVYSGASSDYQWVDNGDGTWTVTDIGTGSPDGTDTLTNIQFLQFTDTMVAIDTVTPPDPNTAPVATADTYTTGTKGSLSVSAADGVLSNDSDADGDALTAVLVSGPSSSEGTLTLNSDGSFTFKPAHKFTGDATFQYAASDGQTQSDPTTVTISVVASTGGGGGGNGGGHGGHGKGGAWFAGDQVAAAASAGHFGLALADSGTDNMPPPDQPLPDENLVGLIGVAEHTHAFSDFTLIG